MSDAPLSNVIEGILAMPCDTTLKRQMLLALKPQCSEEHLVDELLGIILEYRRESEMLAPFRAHYTPEYWERMHSGDGPKGGE